MANTTIVFDIDVTNAEERREWSYLELVENHLLKQTNGVHPLDPFEEADLLEQKRLNDLAKSMEKKYGTMVMMKKSGKRKRIRIDDFLDPGEGYDTQDSFIDDSEAVDVYVAPNVSTKHGGFFVYEGALEGLEDESIEIEAPLGTKHSTSGVLPRPVAKKNKSKELLERAVKRLSAPKQSSTPQRAKLASLDSVFEEVLSRPNSPPSVKCTTTQVSQTQSCSEPNRAKNATAEVDKSQVNSSPPQQQKQTNTSPPLLPSSLSSDITNLVSNLIKLGSPNVGNQRRMMSKQFDAELLNLSGALNKSKVNPSVRSTVFSHIEGVLHWKRKALTRRLKKLNEASEDQKIHPSMDALGDAIARAMPPLLESYMRDKQLHTERVKAWQAENTEQSDNPSATTDGAVPPKRASKPGPPKKLFRWNVECRHLFESIVTMRLQSYHTLNVKGPREEYLRNLFPTLIQLWPDGWITNAALWRAALPIFQKFTATHPTAANKSSIPTTSETSSGTVTSTTSPVTGSMGNGPNISKTKSQQPVNQSSCLKSVPSTSTVTITGPLITSSPYTTKVSTTTSREPIFQQLQGQPSTTVYLASISPPTKPAAETQEALRTMLHSKVAQQRPPTVDADVKQNLMSSPPSIQTSIRLNTPPTVVRNKPAVNTTTTSNIRGSLLMHNTSSAVNQRSSSSALTVISSTHASQQRQNTSPCLSTSGNSTVSNSAVSFRLPSINSFCVNTLPADRSSSAVSRASPNSVAAHYSSVYSNPQQRRHTEPNVAPKPLLRASPMPSPTVLQQNPINSSVQSQKRTYAVENETGSTSKHPAYQLIHTPSASLSTAQIDQLQRFLNSGGRTGQSGQSSALSAATAVLLQREPPPAHQHTAVSQPYRPHINEQLITFAPTTHTSLFVGDTKANDPRQMCPAKKD